MGTPLPNDPSDLCQRFFRLFFTNGSLSEVSSFLSEEISWQGDTELYSATGKDNVLHLLSFAIRYYEGITKDIEFALHPKILVQGIVLVDGTVTITNGRMEKTGFNVAALCVQREASTLISSMQFHKQRTALQNPLDENLNALFDVVPCGILFFESSANDTKMVYMNQFATLLFGYKPEAIQGVKGRALNDLVAAEDAAAFAQTFETLLKDPTRKKVELKMRVQTTRGERWLYSVSYALHRTAEKVFIVVSTVDITQEMNEHAGFQSIITNIPASICTFEAIDGVLWQHYISDSFPEKLGYPTEGFRERPLSLDFPLVHRDDVDDVRKQYAKMLQGEESIDATFRARMASGRYIWCNVIARRFPSDAGNPLYYGIYSDVDEKMHAQQALAAAKNELERTITSLPGAVAIFTHNQDQLTLVYFSDQLCAILGVSREEYLQSVTPQKPLGNYWQSLSQNADCESLLMNTAEPVTRICKAQKKDGTMLWVRLVYRTLGDADASYLYCIITDITEEMQLRQKEQWLSERYRILSEVADTTIFDYNPLQDSIIYRIHTQQSDTAGSVLPNFSEYLRSNSLVHPDDRSKCCEKLAQAILTPVNDTMEVRMDYLHNGYQWFRIHYISLADEDGVILRIIGRLNSIQAEKEKEATMLASIRREKLFRRSSIANALLIKEFSLPTQEPIHSESEVHPPWLPHNLSFLDTIAFLCAHYLHPEDSAPIYNQLITKSANGKQAWHVKEESFECRVKTDGFPIDYRWARFVVTIVYSEWDRQFYSSISLSDIHDEKLSRLSALTLATTDPLTGLDKRKPFEEKITQQLHQLSIADPTDSQYALLCIAIDDFSNIIDYMSFEYGETVLIQAAQTLKALAHENDLVCRYSDDSFAMFLAKIPGEEVLRERLRVISLAFNRHIDKSLSISASIGCAALSSGQTAANLTSHAEKALRFARIQGGNQYCIYHEKLDNLIKAYARKQFAQSQNKSSNVLIRTFGHFDVFVNGSAILFNYPKAKELLALLVDRKGGYVSSGDAISCLWEDQPADKLILAKYRKTALQLNRILEENGISNIIQNSSGKRRVNIDLFDCDYYQFLSGAPKAQSLFRGQYLTDYSWAEETLGQLISLHHVDEA